jgi:symplekin
LSTVDGELAVSYVGDGSVANLQLTDFKFPPPRELSEDDRISLMRNSASRIWSGGADLISGEMTLESSQSNNNTVEMWMLLLVRMVTRVAEPPSLETIIADDVKNDDTASQELELYVRQDKLRQTLLDYVMSDFSSRCETSVSQNLCCDLMTSTEYSLPRLG